MKDPINDFEFPESWLEKAAVPRPELEERIRKGTAVVLSDGTVLSRGYTTGTTAAAAVKAAVLSLFGKNEAAVSVPTPVGIRAEMPVESAKGGFACVRKAMNDHESDITRGKEFAGFAFFETDGQAPVFPELVGESDLVPERLFASVRTETVRADIYAGIGIGIIRRSGFETPVGCPAVNPKPRKQIEDAVSEALCSVPQTEARHIRVVLFIPEGVALSRLTLNEKIGIVGGISVLGTTGFVEPWNDHLGEMKDDIIRKSRKIVLTTGRQGMAHSSMLFPGYDVVLVGSRITEGIGAAVSADEIIVCGLPGLVLKWGNPDMMKDSGFATVVEMLDRDPENGRIKEAFAAAVRKGKGSRIVVIDRSGKVLMDSEKA